MEYCLFPRILKEPVMKNQVSSFMLLRSFWLLLFLWTLMSGVSAQRATSLHTPSSPISATVTQITSSPWDTLELYKTPKTYPDDLCKLNGFKSFFYEGLEYKGCNTRIFAYYKKPAGTPPPEGWPAVICVHGGGGTAFPEWVQTWVDHGYAAIAMDLEGHLPKGEFPNREWHEKAGPPRITTFGDIELADREQWFFHAVVDVIRANSLLRSFSDINKKKIGIHGISWGGVITEAVIGIDHRLAFAISVYGCGFLYQTTCPGFKKFFDVMSNDQLSTYKSKWDPSIYLPDCKIPTLFYIGSNDGAFPLDIWQKSALLIKGKRMFCIPVNSEHGHIWNQKEIFAFADEVARNGRPLLQIGNAEIVDGIATAEISMYSNSQDSFVSAIQLVYTKDTCDWQHRKWQSIPAKFENKTALCELPPLTKAFYFSITDNHDLTFSSAYKETQCEYSGKLSRIIVKPIK
jgi:dienelactone hydrolase